MMIARVVLVAALLVCAVSGRFVSFTAPGAGDGPEYVVSGDLSFQIDEAVYVDFGGASVSAETQCGTMQSTVIRWTEGDIPCQMTYKFEMLPANRGSWVLTNLDIRAGSDHVYGILNDNDSPVGAPSSEADQARILEAPHARVAVNLYDSADLHRGTLFMSNITMFGVPQCGQTVAVTETYVDHDLHDVCTAAHSDAAVTVTTDCFSTGGDKKAEGSFLGLFIFFIIAFTLYCVIGVSYKRFRLGLTGVDQLPNPNVWIGLANACANCTAFVRGGCKRDASSPSTAGYSAASTEPPPYDW